MLKQSLKSIALGAAVICGVLFAAPAHAQKPDSYNFDGYNKMKGADVKALMAGRTFWGRLQYDRYYFGQDGVFVEQFLKADSPVAPGTTYTGKWSVDGDGALCWSYEGVNTPQTVALPQGGCYDVYMGPDKYKALPKYTDPLYLVKKGDTSKTTVEYFWNRWIDGRMVLENGFAQTFDETVQTMTDIKNKFSAADGTTVPPLDAANPLDGDMKEYYDAVVGKIIYTPYHYLYFAPNGDYVFYNRGDFDMNRGDLAALTAKAKKGRWLIARNMHCWSLADKKGNTTCQYVAKGMTLDHSVPAFVTHVDDGFTRVLDGNPVGITTVEQTGVPAAFTSIAGQ